MALVKRRERRADHLKYNGSFSWGTWRLTAEGQGQPQGLPLRAFNGREDGGGGALVWGWRGLRIMLRGGGFGLFAGRM